MNRTRPSLPRHQKRHHKRTSPINERIFNRRNYPTRKGPGKEARKKTRITIKINGQKDRRQTLYASFSLGPCLYNKKHRTLGIGYKEEERWKVSEFKKICITSLKNRHESSSLFFFIQMRQKDLFLQRKLSEIIIDIMYSSQSSCPCYDLNFKSLNSSLGPIVPSNLFSIKTVNNEFTVLINWRILKSKVQIFTFAVVKKRSTPTNSFLTYGLLQTVL